MRHRSTGLLALTLLASPAHAQTPSLAPDTFFELKIRPTLAARCFKCHGGEKVSGGLRLDSRAALLRGGERGPALVPGSPERSLLLKAIRHADPDLRMPPGGRLPAEAAADFALWIREGAFSPEAKAGAG